MTEPGHRPHQSHLGDMKGNTDCVDCSFRGLSRIKSANEVTAWACQTCGIAEARLKQNSPKHTWAETVSEVLLNPCFKKSWSVFDWACLRQQSQENCSRKSHLFHAGRFGPGLSECWWKAWWSLALHCRGLPAAAYRDLLTRLLDTSS